MRLRCVTAILRARLYAQRRIVGYAWAAAFLAGVVQPSGLAAPLFLCSLLGIAMALAQSPGIHPHLDYCEESAPLYGRELARARALVPCTAAALAAVLFALGQAFGDASRAPLTAIIALAAVLAGTLTALSATIRHGMSRLLYVALAAAACCSAYLLVAAAHCVPAELAFCSVTAFFALRQYGEALARYDPI